MFVIFWYKEVVSSNE